MKRLSFFLTLIFALGVGLAAEPAFAQATRTWVSGVGDDANPCSRTAPCKTFAGAISKTAAGGEIDTLDPGGFGGVTITKSLTIDGSGGGLSSVLVAGTPGITINAPGGTVILRNIQINGLGSTTTPGTYGVNIVAANNVNIENAQIFGFQNIGVNFTPSGGTQAVLKIVDTMITQNVGGGVLVAPSGQSAVATLVNVTASQNKYGLRVQDSGKATVFRSQMSESSSNGIIAASTSLACEVNVQDSIADNNGAYGVASSGTGATLRISRVGLYDNVTAGIGALGGAVLSYGNNSNSNNASGAPTGTITAQ
ncbi:right-handed parallel beta-helix repeat-containing protein [Methylocapsa sp. S129]|uniref:right-handed parallel beta-helix repeat-containing protein n=1 Tax=Methylocapsa sp. S129 TaxID=1641869 RepID=UPI00131CC004|nr:right-handed parallel beta-helix repeat-containing protein [Methylocapsa sp. S129]